MIGDIIVKVLIVMAVGLLLGYFTTAAMTSKPTIDAATGARTYTYIRSTKALALISLFLPVLFGAVSFTVYRAGESDYVVWLIICLVFTAASGFLLVECFVARLIVTAEGLTSISPWTGERFFRWEEIESIRYSKLSRWYVIVGPNRKKIYAPEYLNGFADLTAVLRRRIPAESWKHR